MAIAAQSGGVANSNNVAVITLATAAFNSVNTGRIWVVVVLLDNTVSVSTVTDTGGGTTYSLVVALNVSATLRIELWRCDNPATKTGDVVTANFGSAKAAIAAEQWNGDIGVEATNPTLNATNFFPEADFPVGFLNDWALAFIGFNGGAGDTITASVGTLRRSSIGAAGGAGVAIVDSGAASGGATLRGIVKLNASRQWGGIGAGIQGTSTAVLYKDYEGRLPLFVGPTRLVSAKMPAGGGGGILPPAGDGQIFPPTVRPY
jgi:hypothetical protein